MFKLYLIATAFSVFGQLLLILMIQHNKELQQHPMQLVKLIMLVDVYVDIEFLMSFGSCGLSRVFEDTVLFS